MTSSRQQNEQIAALSDPFAQSSVRAAYHIRRYLILYVCGILGALSLAILPVVNGGSTVSARGTVSTGGGQPGTGASASQAPGASSPEGSAAVGSSGISGPNGPSGGANVAGTALAEGGGSGGPAAVPQVGTGLTRGGTACTKGVRQIPYSAYADYCEAKYTGNNGGATANGVTSTSITIAVRKTQDAQGANALEVQAEAEPAGGVSTDTNWTYIQKLVQWMNTQFELYGRQVKLVLFNGQGSGTNESVGQGQAAACDDADAASTTTHAFGDINWDGILESQPFADCAARYHLYVPEGAAYFPESMFQSWNPYVWAVTMNCSLIAEELGEWIGKQLAPFPAKWAGNDGVVNLNGKNRKFATYVPNNAGYQECASRADQIESSTYHIPSSRQDQYNYALDISTFPQDAQKAIVQFAAHQDTTVVLSCDPISPIFLTQDAVQQNYYPEWALTGVALTDTDNFAQLWDQKAISGHLFGLSQNASTQAVLNPNGEGGKAVTAAGLPVNASSVLDYIELLPLFDQLQIAGPDLTAANIAAHTPSIPPGTGIAGTWDFGHGHTAIVDSRQIYWDASGQSAADGRSGTYVEVYNGKRFQVGQFPDSVPPYYP